MSQSIPDTPPGPTAATLNSASAVIDALGGTQAVAELLQVGASAVSNYRKNGFPARAHYTLSRACIARGLNVAGHVFGETDRPATPAMAPVHADGLSGFFIDAGFEAISMPVLQPAAPFIDRMGEEMRRRLYTFTDPAGEQLCLRPDLTIPAAHVYLAEYSGQTARLCYEGLAFRYQSRGAGKPEEFTQAGVEIIGGQDALADEADLLRTIVAALKAFGVTQYNIKLNHLGLFPVFLAGLGVSARMVARLERKFHNVTGFTDDLMADARPPARVGPQFMPEGDAMIAGRSLDSIRQRAMALQSQQDQTLTEIQRQAIQSYAGLAGPPADIMRRLADMMGPAAAELAPFENYWSDLIARAGLPADRVTLTMNHGRKMAYYTGLAFEVHVPALGPREIIASGGRYDDLLQTLGAATPLPAIGGALAVERVREAAALESFGASEGAS
ncbi:MAG: ATP phosphoribosyltransferase regulatory subunit [Rhodobiaceae bacterium UBA7378]|nr:MAG: ATP phosphoribosyltransferase regulatory subunit [Rhodobiaceae bacterium UBA7378]